MTKIVPATPELEAFYAEALTSIAAIARKHGDKARLIDMIAVTSTAVGRMICAAFPNERDLARATAIANMDEAINTHAQGQPTPMEKQ